MAAGYSGTPLARKLGIKEMFVVGVVHEPPHFRRLLAPIPDGVAFRTALRGRFDVVVAFFVSRKKFEARLASMSRAIFPAGGLWICWPKRVSKVPTDITEDIVREVILPIGLVDVKVCAIDEVWSGLRVVHRKENR